MRSRTLNSAGAIVMALAIGALAFFAYAELVLRPKARQARTVILLNNLAQACQLYRTHQGRLPASLADLYHNRSNIVYLMPEDEHLGTNDGWRNPIYYGQLDQERGHGIVVSKGRDGLPGGDGVDADIEVRFGDAGR